MRTRYTKSSDEIRRLQAIYAAPAFLAIRSLGLTFESDPDVIAEVLPPPLLPAARPLVSVSIYEVGRSNCVGPFAGASVDLACTFEGEPGFYCLAMPMSTDLALVFGRELYAEPKKLAEIRLDTRQRHVRGTVTRYGIPFIEVTGRFEAEPETAEREGQSHHYYFKYLPAADGQGLAHDPQLICVTRRTVARRIARGAGTLAFRESPHDPVIDLPVLAVGGATFSESDAYTSACVAATVPGADFLPFAYGKLDDLTVWAGAGAPAPA